jgi:hypothetical protein
MGVLGLNGENNPADKKYLSDLTQALQELGWINGRNLRMDVRWAGGNLDRLRMYATELVDLRGRCNSKRERFQSCSWGLAIRSPADWLKTFHVPRAIPPA